MTELRDIATEVTSTPLGRRSFVAWSAVVGGSTALTACNTEQGDQPRPYDPESETHVWSACTVNCGSRCPLRMVVKDGVIVRIDPDDTGDDELGSQQVRACVRGRSIRQRIYSRSGSPNRCVAPANAVPTNGGRFPGMRHSPSSPTS